MFDRFELWASRRLDSIPLPRPLHANPGKCMEDKFMSHSSYSPPLTQMTHPFPGPYGKNKKGRHRKEDKTKEDACPQGQSWNGLHQQRNTTRRLVSLKFRKTQLCKYEFIPDLIDVTGLCYRA
jgi:hypothetical protein